MSKKLPLEEELYECLRRGTKIPEISTLDKHNVDVNFARKGWTLLHAAVKRNNLELVKWLLFKGADVNPLNIYGVPMPGSSPIDVATSNGLPDITQILLDHDARINPMMLFLAIWNKESDVARVLLKYGSNLPDADYDNAEDHRRYYQFCKYTIDGNAEKVKELLPNTRDVDFCQIKGKSPLHFAVLTNRFEIVQLLVQAGASINKNEDYNRESVLHDAIKRASLEVLDYLLEHQADPNCDFFHGVTPLQAASDAPYVFIERLLKHGARDINDKINENSGSTLLHDACSYGRERFAEIELCLRYKADVNRADDEGNTPLNVASHHPVLEVLELLLRHGADPNLANNQLETPLHRASRSGCEKCVELLLSYGADITARDDEGRTVIHWAAKNCKTSEPLRLLLHRRAVQVNAKDFYGNTALHGNLMYNAVYCDNFILLLRFLGSVKIANDSSKTPFDEQRPKLSLLGYGVLESDFQAMQKSEDDQRAEGEMMEIYKKELTEMKGVVIDQKTGTTLYDVLIMKRNQIWKYADNEKLAEVCNILEKDFKLVYPHYGFLLYIQYKRGLERKKRMEEAKESLDYLIGCKMPQGCAEKILKSFSDARLKSMRMEKILETKK